MTPEDEWRQSFGRLARWMEQNRSELSELVKRARAAEKLPPGHPKAPEAWAFVFHQLPHDALRLGKHLPNPLKVRGRPRGLSAATVNALQAMREHLDAHGGTERAAARHVLTGDGRAEVSGLSNKVDHLVQAYRRGK